MASLDVKRPAHLLVKGYRLACQIYLSCRLDGSTGSTKCLLMHPVYLMNLACRSLIRMLMLIFFYHQARLSQAAKMRFSEETDHKSCQRLTSTDLRAMVCAGNGRAWSDIDEERQFLWDTSDHGNFESLYYTVYLRAKMMDARVEVYRRVLSGVCNHQVWSTRQRRSRPGNMFTEHRSFRFDLLCKEAAGSCSRFHYW